MVDLKEFFYPNKFKIAFFLLFIIPSISLMIILVSIEYIYSSFSYDSQYIFNYLLFMIIFSIYVVLGSIFSYLFGCFIDTFIQNEKIKIGIAIISGIVSLIIVYVLFKMVTEPVICDPVHVPGNNQTICDPVHKPSGESYNTNALGELKIDKSAVKNSLEQCINNLKY